uniref:Gem (nuclear organelle) associated protein 7 n=1 Tax=Oryzias sinensis TaxID=183150 RepID=A0A8C7XKH1_9TELE
MTTPVPVLRLPKGPDPNSRGFDPNSPRYIALCRTTVATTEAAGGDEEELQQEQHARSVLRERFLRCLLAMNNKKVSDLHTPIGVQKEALIRSQDVISFTFDA